MYTISAEEVRDDMLLLEANCSDSGLEALSGLDKLLRQQAWSGRTLNEWISVSVIVCEPHNVALFSTALSKLNIDQAVVNSKPLYGARSAIVIEAVGELAPLAASASSSKWVAKP